MELINKLRLIIEGLEQKDFFKYLVVLLIFIVLLTGTILFWHYNKISGLRESLEELNDVREDTVLPILRRMDTVSLQKKQVNAILAKDKDFKIGDYLNKLLRKQGLTFNSITPSTVDLGNSYNEVFAKVQLSEMDMRQLCEFLETIEKNERVYAKDLEIIKSKKNPGTIDVNVTVATLEPKQIAKT